MQQRVLLTVSLATDSALVILDEPCANLDRTGIEWYQQRLSEFPDDATLIICTNDRKEDYSKADIMINL
jgi:energy-coupling factor transporter ATP-binding protein EcfA2